MNDQQQNNFPSGHLNTESGPSEHVKHGHLVFFYLLALLLALVCGAGGYIYQHNHKSSVKTTSSITSQKSATKVQAISQPILTYISNTTPSSFIVVNSENKIIAKTTISASGTPTIYAEGTQALLLGETNPPSLASPNASAKYVLINYNGVETTISPSISSILSDVIAEYNGSQLLLNGSNELIYTDCSSSTNNCSLKSLNLLTGKSVTSLTEPSTKTDSGVQSSIGLMYVKNNIVTYEYNDQNSGLDTIQTYNLSLGKLISSFPTVVPTLNAPVASSDGLMAIYTDQNNDGVRYVLNLSTGKTITFNSSIPSDNQNYLWSPNDQDVAFTAPYPGQSQSSQAETIDLINVSTGQTVTINTFGNPQFNEVSLYAWSSNEDVYYAVSQTTTADGFTGIPSQIDEINVSNNTILGNPAPSGYTFLPIQSQSVFDTSD